MKGIVITTKNEMRVQEFSEPAHRSIGDAVGGWIEIVHPMRLEQTYCMNLKKWLRGEDDNG